MQHREKNINNNVSDDVIVPSLATVLVYSCHPLFSVYQMQPHLDFVLVAYRRHPLWWSRGKVGKPWWATIGIQELRQCLPSYPKKNGKKKKTLRTQMTTRRNNNINLWRLRSCHITTSHLLLLLPWWRGLANVNGQKLVSWITLELFTIDINGIFN